MSMQIKLRIQVFFFFSGLLSLGPSHSSPPSITFRFIYQRKTRATNHEIYRGIDREQKKNEKRKMYRELVQNKLDFLLFPNK